MRFLLFKHFGQEQLVCSKPLTHDISSVPLAVSSSRKTLDKFRCPFLQYYRIVRSIIWFKFYSVLRTNNKLTSVQSLITWPNILNRVQSPLSLQHQQDFWLASFPCRETKTARVNTCLRIGLIWTTVSSAWQTVQHFQKYILPKHPLLAEQIKCPYTYFIPYRLKSLESVAPLLCVISICQIPHTLKQPSYLCKGSLETQEPLKPLIVKSRIQSLRVTTNLVQIYI